MSTVKKLFGRLVREEEGVTMIEYALLAALIAIVAIISITAVGTKVNETFDTVDSALPG